MTDWQRLRRALSAVAVAVCLSACGGGQQPDEAAPAAKVLTDEQAQALAVTRFNNYSAGRVRLAIEAHGAVDMDLDVVVDYRLHAAYGTYAIESDGDQPDSGGLIAWSGQQVGVADGDDPAQIPGPRKWTMRALNSKQPLDVALVLALNLGADRPENPLLLQQSTARLVGFEGKGDDLRWVIRGPGAEGQTESRTTYWIDTRGNLSRMEAAIGANEPSVYQVEESGITEPLPAEVLGYLRIDG